ncbi:flagellar basal body-associated protein FliL [Calidifontibacillus erzurumensis]|uniref:Flagellar protein FliL n=1 Tax=Calidifontibacillus erzurumensis TaxID=2741433 RepID=A0A8J8GDI9_9BACI|nr:flagellar basal body-associated protein FliL [Calidifontibacillus erzurumensis]NSL51176.1 flagellar basal body-associated protein FliL [Calidifontibacillus erzurumensis]
MTNNKLIQLMLIILIIITLSGVVAYFVIINVTKDIHNKEQSIEEILKLSIDTEELTTNLNDGSYLIIQFKIQADSKDAKAELEKRDFQINNILIQELAAMSEEQFTSKEGLLEVEETIKKRLNEIVQAGTVQKVYITKRLVQ